MVAGRRALGRSGAVIMGATLDTAGTTVTVIVGTIETHRLAATVGITFKVDTRPRPIPLRKFDGNRDSRL